MPIISPTAISPHRIGKAGINWSSYWARQIAAWQTTDELVHSGGLEAALFAGTTAVGCAVGYDYLTEVMTTSSRRIRQDGYVYGVKVQIPAASPTGRAKFKIYRKNASIATRIDFIAESEWVTIMGTGSVYTAEYILTSPIACKIGDYFGFALERNVEEKSPQILYQAQAGATRVRINDDNLTRLDLVNNKAGNAYDMCVEALTCKPFVCISGDSINVGWAIHRAWYDGETALTTIVGDPGYQLQQILPTLLYQNHAKGGQTWDWVRTTGAVSALATKPKYLIVHAGINDLSAGYSAATILSDIADVKTLCDAAGTILIIDEVTPADNRSDAISANIRAFNTALRAWCAANNVTLVSMHDDYGDIRISTGELDDLKDEYNHDGVHFNQAGTNEQARRWSLAL